MKFKDRLKILEVLRFISLFLVGFMIGDCIVNDQYSALLKLVFVIVYLLGQGIINRDLMRYLK